VPADTKTVKPARTKQAVGLLQHVVNEASLSFMQLNFRWWLILLVLAALAACSDAKKEAPPQADVESLLRERAEKEKREAEADVNPALGVTITWTIQEVQVRPQPGNDAQPYAGTIRFLIESQTPELDGVATERFDRSYEYVWDASTGAWMPK
jgi:hypothetical protein